jgi:hypothetical protein
MSQDNTLKEKAYVKFNIFTKIEGGQDKFKIDIEEKNISLILANPEIMLGLLESFQKFEDALGNFIKGAAGLINFKGNFKEE